MKNQFVGWHLDFVGFSASLLCALHCAALPFLLTLAPLAGLQFLDNHWVEISLILLSFFIASNALMHGYRRHHHRWLPLVIAVFGFVLIGIAQALESEFTELVLMPLGGITIAIAHLINWKFINQSRLRFDDKVPDNKAALEEVHQ
ncbi:MAG: MerC domain-containing protein [Bacteroidota bacterium]